MRARSFSRRSSPASAVGAVALLLIAGCSAGSPSAGAGSGSAVVVVQDSSLTDPRGLHRFGGRVYFENHDTVASLHTFTVVVARADSDGQDDVLRAHVFTDVDGYLYGAPSIQAFAADPRMRTQLFDPHATPKYLSERGKQVAEFGGYRSEPGRLSDDFVLRPIPLAFAVTVVGASPGAVWVIPKLHHRRGPIAFAAKFELDDLRLEGPTAEVGLLSDDVDETVRVELDERTSFRNVGRDSRRLSFGEGRDTRCRCIASTSSSLRRRAFRPSASMWRRRRRRGTTTRGGPVSTNQTCVAATLAAWRSSICRRVDGG